jgi:hypothetical protein
MATPLRSLPQPQLGLDEKVVEIPELESALVRAGRFRITRSAVAARSVSFDTDPTSRLNITFLGGE